jgi:calcineurin-like phosphoesterase family protein
VKDLKIILEGRKRPQLWFISDLHLGHLNVIRYSKRPFASLEAMNAALINNWNACVQPDDTIFCLGDFALARGHDKRDQLKNYLRQLAGKKYLIYGNHDTNALASDEGLVREFFLDAWDLKDIKVQDPDANGERQGGYQRITLCHYAMDVWNKSHFGAWQLYGHSHGSRPELSTTRKMDVGVDGTAGRFGRTPDNYRPISYAEVKAIMKTRTFEPVDGHGAGKGDDDE